MHNRQSQHGFECVGIIGQRVKIKSLPGAKEFKTLEWVGFYTESGRGHPFPPATLCAPDVGTTLSQILNPPLSGVKKVTVPAK